MCKLIRYESSPRLRIEMEGGKKAKSPKTEAKHSIQEHFASKHTRGANDNSGFQC